MADDRRPLVEWLKLDKQTVSDLNRYLYELNVSVRDWFDRNSPTDQATSLERADRQTLYRYINDVRGSLAINEYSLLSSNMTAAAEAAARHAFSYERDYWDMVLSPEEIEQMEAASAATARASMDTVVARYLSSRKTLSDRVYDSALLQSGMLNKIIDTAILRGVSWRDLARAVRSSINPRVPGGVSYAAKRLARTEINNAFHATSLQRYKESEIVDFVKWNLSNSHPEGDECDEYAEHVVPDHDELGLWLVGAVPEKPHPNCFCYITPFLPSPEDFMKSIFGEVDYEKGSKTSRKDLPSANRLDLTEEERQALDDYKSYTYGIINQNLIRGDLDRVRRFTDPIDSAMRKGAKQMLANTIVVRGQSHKDFFESLEIGISNAALEREFPGQDPNNIRDRVGTRHSIMADYDVSSAIGKEYVSKQYLSTTVADKTAPAYASENIQMRIFVPKGTPSVYLDDEDWENELLLGRGRRMRLIGAVLDTERNSWLVNVLVVS